MAAWTAYAGFAEPGHKVSVAAGDTITAEQKTMSRGPLRARARLFHSFRRPYSRPPIVFIVGAPG